ncbi:MAG: chlorite dismutase family protein [Caldimonas sp.]
MHTSQQSNPRLFAFVAGDQGFWKIDRTLAVMGEPISAASRLSIFSGAVPVQGAGFAWALRGTASNERYVLHEEKAQLVSKQEGLGRPAARCAALIPIRKTAAWWALPQDVRRKIFEDQSHHIAIGMNYLPAVARRLHHCRDLESAEPFDFLTWFEFNKSDEPSFDELLATLRVTEEWAFVDREVEMRLSQGGD